MLFSRNKNDVLLEWLSHVTYSHQGQEIALKPLYLGKSESQSLNSFEMNSEPLQSWVTFQTLYFSISNACKFIGKTGNVVVS